MTAPRKPAAFRIEPEAPPKQQAALRQPDAAAARKPRTVNADLAVVTPAEIDVFDEPDIIAAEPPPATAPRQRSISGSLFFGALGVLVSLALGLWTDQLIRDLFARAEWLGWLAAGMAVIAVPNHDFPPESGALDRADRVLDSLMELTPHLVRSL